MRTGGRVKQCRDVERTETGKQADGQKRTPPPQGQREHGR